MLWLAIMLIEFECSNIMDFDAATGRNVICQNRIVVAHDQIGAMIECTKCGQTVEVPFETDTTKSSSSVQRDKTLPSVAASKKGKSNTQKNKRPVRNVGTTPDLLAPPSDIMSRDFSGDGGRMLTATDNACPKCSAPMNSKGKCTQCRYVEQRFESAYLPIEKITLKRTGFQKWFCETLSEGVSMNVVALASHFGIGLFFVLGAVASLMFGSYLSLFSLVVAVAFYGAFIYKGYQLRHNPRAKLAWFQKLIWNSLLRILRAKKWAGIENRRKPNIVDKRNAPLTDEMFPAVEGLKTCQVLDLEATLVSDSSLRLLYGHKHLSCLVLRKTNVTAEGVMRLQQANPSLWIWT